jgi:integrase
MAFIDRQLEDVRPADIAAWRDKRLSEVAAPSVRREMVLLRSVLELCRTEWGWLHTNPMDGVAWADKGKPRSRRISDAEIAKLVKSSRLKDVAGNATQRVMLAFQFAIETAMRAGEICGLREADLHPTWAHLPETKNGDERDVPLSKAALAVLARLPKSPRVFDLNPASLDALWRALRDRTDIVDLHFHDTRHEAITRLARKLNVPELARMVGTRDLKTLMTYYNPSASDIAARLDL